MPKFKTFFDKGRAAAIRKSVQGRQEKARKLLQRLSWLHDNVGVHSTAQTDEINRLRIEYAKKSRELMEEYTQREIDVIEDKEDKFRQKIVDSQGNPIE